MYTRDHIERALDFLGGEEITDEEFKAFVDVEDEALTFMVSNIADICVQEGFKDGRSIKTWCEAAAFMGYAIAKRLDEDNERE